MTTSEEVHAKLDRLTVAILKVKRDRDELLKMCKTVLESTCDDEEYYRPMLRAVIDRAESPV